MVNIVIFGGTEFIGLSLAQISGDGAYDTYEIWESLKEFKIIRDL